MCSSSISELGLIVIIVNAGRVVSSVCGFDVRTLVVLEREKDMLDLRGVPHALYIHMIPHSASPTGCMERACQPGIPEGLLDLALPQAHRSSPAFSHKKLRGV
jgi:hypothetical protein